MSVPEFRWVSYVFAAHRYQEMLSANSTFLPALFLSRRKDSVFNWLYFTTLAKACQGIFEIFLVF